MKVISMYLPQFHRVKENDEWWGEGFTEWSAVRKAEKIFPGQYQPRVPLNEYYYDLLDKETMIWQTQLMKKYGIDAQCFYHYWFKEGRQILEKPAENLLKWKEIDMPFCFAWANQTWARTWSKLNNKNVWASTFEKTDGIADSGILLEQKYGDEGQWKKHFDYLCPFFEDHRYIKIDDKPVFMICNAAVIPCLDEMLGKWRQWAKEHGFSGVYIIGTDNSQIIEQELNAVLYHEPQHTIQKFVDKRRERDKVFTLDYDKIWGKLLEFRSKSEKALYGGFIDYDDTPRRGNAGMVMEHAEPGKFKLYLTELLAKNKAAHNELIFLNAWNEWGEGMYLEPDEEYSYQYLEAVTYAKEHYESYCQKYESQSLQTGNDSDEIEALLKRCAKYESYWRILEAWICLKERQVSLATYFLDKGISSIAIYGIGMLGKHLLVELQEEDEIQVAYAIDQKSDGIHVGIKVYSPDEDFPEVDAIVVSATFAYGEIKRYLETKGHKNIISLEEIVTEL